ncbi:Ig-like domain-containing protein [Streptococcus mutans]|uniref:Ig-like domain-containing protein n=1 Tax=Streptococcus mutans TaxID=1309 RepID=UPI001CFCF087|nr:Ig-like domain-containing protein [Streptococcus mutans]MCB4936358.1 Ig-like domain-containing protein [Streptococcus mutans]MCB4988492.1 Ig-like domain-containing protein [Streptococcus mutans]MCB5154194.1 Ig-like domain-containing protein [Streptococcus mutans]
MDSSTKKLTLTYTDYPEMHSDVSGNFYFYTYVDHKVVTKKENVLVIIDVEGEVFSGGKSWFQWCW